MSEQTRRNPARDGEFFRFDPGRDVAYTSDGRRITAELIEQASEHAERSGPPAGLTPGGKSLSGDGEHSPRIQVVVPRSVRDEIAARAAAEHMSMSRWLRRLIERDLAA